LIAEKGENMDIKLVSALAVAVLAITGCSSEQVYNSGKAWRLSECDRIADARERARCRKEAGRSYDEYERDRKGQRPIPTDL
jgi:hypothetical protein